ncbi:hypothetical protein pkur_cds_540 [Pandoravirus kuranda]|uniref:Uncharacterized protein n=2 Tax=Pandoravirus TaxID=2060084 RepID=A0AA95J2A7_9VIRU|nr:hypothetical protein pneo_cds_576 [Pandoravirus neocaledonia]AVK76183.1 hypothetical protein pneo_cds_576 [Pandoravirus neocaledonia]WBR14714.1 hypothetical protein pkur_cds_540 [Pandoravirus kuranda]
MGTTHSTPTGNRTAAPSARYRTSRAPLTAECTFAPGDKVILAGSALRHARQRGCVDVATIIDPAATGPRGEAAMRLRLYNEDAVPRYGDVGRPAEEVLVPCRSRGLVRPLPVHVYDVEPREIENRAAAFWAWADGLSDAMNDADPDRRLRAACACPPGDDRPRRARSKLERDVALSIITAHTPEGVTRFTTLVCDPDNDDNDNDNDDDSPEGMHAERVSGEWEFASDARTDASRCARPVIIATRGMPGGIAQYGIAPMGPERTVQSAALCAYGLPLTPAFYQAVEWDQWPAYATLVEQARSRPGFREGSDAAVVGVDNVWLYRLVTDLVARGYRVAPGIDLAAACP